MKNKLKFTGYKFTPDEGNPEKFWDFVFRGVLERRNMRLTNKALAGYSGDNSKKTLPDSLLKKGGATK